MLTRIFVPITMFLLYCTSSSAIAGPSHQHSASQTRNSQVHVHIDQHCGVAHLHTHSSPNAPDTNNPHHACEEEHDSDDHCCVDHHESESKPVASLVNSQDRPTDATPAALPNLSPGLQTVPSTPTRWLPVRQRPPNHLVLLRTFVMLN